ncbi:MAG TPA: hypothetical protein VGW36_08955, partial [Pyrinomonadaceae bacterium]|nr:hypothetical protein [Pyrinomonadaceae bacterium]
MCSLPNITRVLLVLIILFSATSISGDSPRKFDEIRANQPWSDVMARLDNVAISFQRESSDLVLYVISYAGPKSCIGYAD